MSGKSAKKKSAGKKGGQVTKKDDLLLEAERIMTGGDDYTDRMSMTYLLNIMKNTPVSSPSAYSFCAAAMVTFDKDEMEQAGFPAKKPEKGEKVYEKKKRPARNSVKKEDWKGLQKFIQAKLDATEIEETPVVLQNFMRLADYLGLDAEQKNLIDFLFVAETQEMDQFLSNFAANDRRAIGPLVARALDDPRGYKRYGNMLNPDSPLIKYGLFLVDDPMGQNFLPESDIDLWERLSRPDISEEDLVGSILGKPSFTDLDYSDFEHLGDDLAFVIDLVKKAVERGDKGINILIYGPPGGGKTELSKALAEHIGLKLYSVGEEENTKKVRTPIYDSDGDYVGTSTSEQRPDRTSKQRLAQLMRAQALLKGSKDAFILFDEMEDLLIKGTDTDKKADTDSKIQVNRLLENNEVVTIWVGNDTDQFHDAVRDRFTFSLYVDYPPTLVRKKMWQTQLALKDVTLADTDIAELARKYDATPRQIAKAVQAADITGKGMEAIEISLPSSSKVSYQSREAVSGGNRLTKYFDTGLLNGGEDNAPAVVDGLIGRGNTRESFSLLVNGQKGVGAGSTLRYMGESMTMNTIEVSMKLLSQPTQFSTPEDNVRSAFNIAADGRQFLVIRDLEALVPDPKSGSANWHDNSLVETFIDCALGHKIPFAATADSTIEIPDRVTRVFSDKLGLGPLTAAQRNDAFEIYFEQEAPEALAQMDGLVVADFANVQKLLKRVNDNSPEAITALLKKEQEYRGTRNKGIGFTR